MQTNRSSFKKFSLKGFKYNMKSPPGDHSPKTISEIKELTKIPDNDNIDNYNNLYDEQSVQRIITLFHMLSHVNYYDIFIDR